MKSILSIHNVLFTLCLFLFLIQHTACRGKEKNVTIQGQFAWRDDDEADRVFTEGEYETPPDNIIYLYKMVNYDPDRYDLAKKTAFEEVDSQQLSKSGDFKFELYVDPKEPEIYFVGSYRPEGLFAEGGYSNEVQMVVAEPGNITIKWFYDKTLVTGTPINEKLSEFLYRDHYHPIRDYENALREPHEYRMLNSEGIWVIHAGTLTNEEDSLLEEFKKQEKQKYAGKLFLFLEEYATKNMSEFFKSSANHYLTQEQLSKLLAIEGNKFAEFSMKAY